MTRLPLRGSDPSGTIMYIFMQLLTVAAVVMSRIETGVFGFFDFSVVQATLGGPGGGARTRARRGAIAAWLIRRRIDGGIDQQRDAKAGADALR